MTPNAKKTTSPKPSGSKVVLYALVEGVQHDALRTLAFLRGTSLADLVREALATYLVEHGPSTAEVDDVVRRIRAAAKAAKK